MNREDFYLPGVLENYLEYLGFNPRKFGLLSEISEEFAEEVVKKYGDKIKGIVLEDERRNGYALQGLESSIGLVVVGVEYGVGVNYSQGLCNVLKHKIVSLPS